MAYAHHNPEDGIQEGLAELHLDYMSYISHNFSESTNMQNFIDDYITHRCHVSHTARENMTPDDRMHFEQAQTQLSQYLRNAALDVLKKYNVSVNLLDLENVLDSIAAQIRARKAPISSKNFPQGRPSTSIVKRYAHNIVYLYAHSADQYKHHIRTMIKTKIYHDLVLHHTYSNKMHY